MQGGYNLIMVVLEKRLENHGKKHLSVIGESKEGVHRRLMLNNICVEENDFTPSS